MKLRNWTWQARLLCGAAAIALTAASAHAEAGQFDIPAQPLSTALAQFGVQSQQAIFADSALTSTKISRGVSGAAEPESALSQLLVGTGLAYRKEGDAFVIIQQEGGSGPQSAGAGGDVDALIVTAQKREENIQDVPIAISAFSQEDLTRSQVAGGPDLMTQVPNMTFTKTNFSSYSIQIRGIGTQAISATTDAAVAVAFNNTPFIRNRFFEQEFYDLQRIEVLRGPQGTLYGRNATAGVVNILSAKPSFRYEARLSGDVANYSSTRFEGMVNLPIVEDKVALRLAGAWTKREGYDTNQITGNQIDGRDLWSTRLSLRVAPTDRVEANLIWEHFQEDDDRLRSGKQLCNRDVVTEIGGFTIDYSGGFTSGQAQFSQGCAPASLYSPDSFQAPNGYSIPYYFALGIIGLPVAADVDPYLSTRQSRDLRVIESTVDPEYRSKSDVAELQVRVDLTPELTLSSETGYSTDTLFSLEDYNRFNTRPGAFAPIRPGDFAYRPGLEEDGVFCDPQLGCSDRLIAVDVSSAQSRQFSQEFRLSSDYDGRFNFSLGANFLRYETEDKYYVFINSLTLFAARQQYSSYTLNGGVSPWIPGVSDNHDCLAHGPVYPNTNVAQEVAGCDYIDPNPIGSLNDRGHNYFLSRNPYKLISYAAFGEAYYDITEDLKITAGLRWTVDRKQAPLIPSWLLASGTAGAPISEVIKQEWREPTGRVTIDWSPDLSFTDETLLYASYARGYKAGGANPPGAGPIAYNQGSGFVQAEARVSASHPKTFEPEYINAFEIGAKNTLLDGRVTMNGDVFYYDYEGYQISQIVDRSASNLNFDATVWGVEFEGDWRPAENLRFGLKLGYEDTRVAEGSKAVDLMDRTAGDPNWILVKPHPTQTSNCILPIDTIIVNGQFLGAWAHVSSGSLSDCEYAYLLNLDPVTEQPYIADPFPGYAGFNPETAPNNGEGIDKDLGGNELPNAPHFTATLTADYTLPLPDEWLLTLHTDLYGQTEAWARIFNMEGYDKIKAYTNVNFAAIFTNEDAGWKVMAYVKNVFDRDSITGAFLNSDDTGLTTNVFLTEPRIYGLRVTKDWTGTGTWWNSSHAPGTPYPYALELGGQLQHWRAPSRSLEPSFTDQFQGPAATIEAVQHDIDWGDGRDVKLTWRPQGGLWSLAGGIRFGRTNGGATLHGETVHDRACTFTRNPDGTCTPVYSYVLPIDVSDSTAGNGEDYTLVDFTIGRDVGFGGMDRSSFGLGVRYARFNSSSELQITGIPDFYIPQGFLFDKYTTAHHHRDVASLEGSREFDGAGPVVSWEASKRLLGNEEDGVVSVDWSVGGGVLFGKQSATITGSEDSSYYEGAGFNFVMLAQPPVYVAPTRHINLHRNQSVTAPMLDLSLGVSYEIQRVRLSTGYRWERYFDVLDTGFDKRDETARTIDGPYFKVSVGFGG